MVVYKLAVFSILVHKWIMLIIFRPPLRHTVGGGKKHAYGGYANLQYSYNDILICVDNANNLPIPSESYFA
jgi:hypothetical protein